MLRHIFQGVDDIIWLNADETPVRERLEILELNNLKSIVGNYRLMVIDEIQRIKNAGLLLKLLVDNLKEVQFVATGS